MGDPGRAQIVKEITRLSELLNKAEQKGWLQGINGFPLAAARRGSDLDSPPPTRSAGDIEK
jgi:hypothetical protein